MLLHCCRERSGPVSDSQIMSHFHLYLSVLNSLRLCLCLYTFVTSSIFHLPYNHQGLALYCDSHGRVSLSLDTEQDVCRTTETANHRWNLLNVNKA